MQRSTWTKHREPEATDDRLWELFHESSKVSRFDRSPSNEIVARFMMEQYDYFAFDGFPRVSLPPALTPQAPLGAVIRARRTPQAMRPRTIGLEDLAVLLFHSVGITRPEADGLFPRPFRAAPSAGAMYPLDLFVHATQTKDLPSGMYHYNPHRHDLASLGGGDRSRHLADALIQSELAYDSTLIAFVVATFERSTQKYGERGFRFALIEAGHIAQNLLLTATALNMSGIAIGGYYDRRVDAVLGLDGVTHSVILAVAIGGA